MNEAKQLKDYLIQLLAENRHKYPELLDWVENTTQTTAWGMGVMPAYSTGPYACELQGSKPGRFLKKLSEPGDNRQCYFLDSNGKIICELKYAKYLPKKGRWIVYRTFFLHEDEQIIECSFDSELDGSREADLICVTLTKLANEHVISRYSLYTQGRYMEITYGLLYDKVRSITQKIWAGTYTQRNYEVVEHDKDPVIYELIDSERIKVYPG